MSTHNIDFYEEILSFNYPKLSSYTPLIKYSYFSYLISMKVNILPIYFFLFIYLFFLGGGGGIFNCFESLVQATAQCKTFDPPVFSVIPVVSVFTRPFSL